MLIVQNASEPASLRNALVDIVTAGTIDIRVASAYVTVGGANILLSAVANAVGPAAFAAMPKTLVTSFDFGLTEPQALQHWRALANATVFVSGAQRLAQGSLMPQRAFHPKFYVFGRDPQTCSTLVGSANLTSRGFSVNTEVAWVQQSIPRADADAAFDKARFETTALTDDLLAAYTALRQAQPPPPEIEQEAQPVAAPAPVAAAALPCSGSLSRTEPSTRPITRPCGSTVRPFKADRATNWNCPAGAIGSSDLCSTSMTIRII